MASDSRGLKYLGAILEADFVKNDPNTLHACAVDGIVPWAVVSPGNVEEVSEVVRLAGREKWALLPWGRGSKICLGNPPSRLDVVIKTVRLDKIIDMDRANLTVTAQAGVKLRAIQNALAGQENRSYFHYEDQGVPSTPISSEQENRGCFIPMWPPHSHSATLGGIIAANSCGPTRLMYGLPRDIVLGIRYVAPDGNIIGMGGKTVKNVSGYDMCKLMIGSMGSLGVLCEMTLKLLPLPESRKTCIFSFAGLGDASRFIDRTLKTQLLPAALELLNSRCYRFLAPEGAGRRERGGFAVAVALEGIEEAVNRMIAEMGEMASESGALDRFHLHDKEHPLFWEAHSNLVQWLSERYPDFVSLKANYPMAAYHQFIHEAESLTRENHLDNVILAHAGSGICMIHLLMDGEDRKAGHGVVRAVERLLEACRDLGGNLVLERATSPLKGRLPVWGLPREDLFIMKRIKEQMDPMGLFCPGRFVGRI